MEVLTLVFIRNFESNFFLRLPCKNFESCDNFKHANFIHIDFPLPKYRVAHEMVENKCIGEVLSHSQLKAMTARHISCTSQRDDDEANEIVQNNKRPMRIPFLTPMNDRILNWAFPVGVAQ